MILQPLRAFWGKNSPRNSPKLARFPVKITNFDRKKCGTEQCWSQKKLRIRCSVHASIVDVLFVFLLSCRWPQSCRFSKLYTQNRANFDRKNRTISVPNVRTTCNVRAQKQSTRWMIRVTHSCACCDDFAAAARVLRAKLAPKLTKTCAFSK